MEISKEQNIARSLQPNASIAKAIEVLILHDSQSAAAAIASTLNNQVDFTVNWQQVATKQAYCQSLNPQLDLIFYHVESTQLKLTEAIELLLEHHLDIPLLAIAGEASISQAVAAIKAGATDYIPATELDRLPTAVKQALSASNTCSQIAKCTLETEQQLQKLITDNADGIVVVDDRGIVQFINPAALELFGKSEADLIGEPLGFPVVNGDYLEVDIPQTAAPNLVAQMRVSQIRWQGTNANIVSLRDITKIKQVELERTKLLEEAQAANRAKDEFLAILSHELRTPLNPIVGWSQLLQSGRLNEAQMEKGVEIIQRNAMLQSQLIEDILDISRIVRGKIELQAAPVNLSNIIDNALDTVKLAAKAKSIQINANIDQKKILVWGDATRLQQIIWNLLTNAIKFTPQGGKVDINLSTIANNSSLVENNRQSSDRTIQAHGAFKSATQVRGTAPPEFIRGTRPYNLEPTTKDNFVRVQVQDTGKGITPDFLPYVFDYFRQAENVKTRSNGGLGLGLAIVRHLVELHGGTVRVDSPGVDRGATFTITLPVVKVSDELAVPSSFSQPANNFKGIKALVVDDHDSSRDLVIFILENQGINTKSAVSANEALNIIKEFQPDILIADIGMPVIDGYELIAKVKKLSTIEPESFKAIALSAYASDTDRQQSLAAGFDLHINKPIDVNNFLQAIAQLVR